MKHRYGDMSNLNARWDAVQVSGLGGPSGRQYWDTSDLNARWDQVPEAALGAGSIAGGSLGSLGAGDTSYPWKEYSAATSQLQQEINAWLQAAGYCPIGQDGKLGPTTCGAAVFYRDESGYGGAKNISGGVPSTCQTFSFTPMKPPCPGLTSSAPKPEPAVAPATPATASISSGGDWIWLAVGGLVAAGAVGAALYYKKRR
jgi:hypothetical protein